VVWGIISCSCEYAWPSGPPADSQPASAPADAPATQPAASQPARALPGSRIDLARAIRKALVIGVFVAADEGNEEVHGTGQVSDSQHFTAIAIFKGSLPLGDVFIGYDFTEAGNLEREIRKGEQVILLLWKVELQPIPFWRVIKALPDTPENRKLVGAPATQPATAPAGMTARQRKEMLLAAMQAEPPDLAAARQALEDVGNVEFWLAKGPVPDADLEKEKSSDVNLQHWNGNAKNYLVYSDALNRLDRGPAPQAWLERMSWGRKNGFRLEFVWLAVAPTEKTRLRRDLLLTEADAKIRKGLLELSKQFPALRKTGYRPLEEELRDSPTGRVSICVGRNVGFKAGTEPTVPPENRYSIVVFIRPLHFIEHGESVAQLAEDMLPQYENLALMGQVHYAATDTKLDKAVKSVINDALAPLKELNKKAVAGTPDETPATAPAVRQGIPPASAPATSESETITFPPELKVAWSKETLPEAARKAVGNALRPHLKSRDNRVRMTWFLHGKPQIAMICQVSLDSGKVYTAREVYDWATQGASWGNRLDKEGIEIVGRIARDLPPSETSVDSRYCVLVSVPAPGIARRPSPLPARRPSLAAASAASEGGSQGWPPPTTAPAGRELRVYDRRKLPDGIERLYEIVEAHVGYYAQEAAADNDQAAPATKPTAAETNPARGDALLAQAKEVRAKHPAAPREMWEQLAALLQPGMTVGDMESVLGTPSDGSYNQYPHRNRVTLIYRLSARFRVRAVAEFANHIDTLEHAILLAPPQIEDEHLIHEEPRPTPTTAASAGRK
jgi:hypothetical protein